MTTNPHAIYECLLDRVSSALIEEVLIGLTWTLCRTDTYTGLAMSPPVLSRTLAWSGSLVGKNAMDLASWVRSWNPHEAVIGMAAINAVINAGADALYTQARRLPNTTLANLAVFDYFLPDLQGQKVVVVGRYPFLERYSQQMDLTVLERNPTADDYPDPACEFLLPEADWVFLTASSIPNKTFPRLAELSKQAKLVLMGATVPWLPELATFGVDFLAGVKIENPTQLRQTVAEGGGVKIFEQGATYHVLAL
ncbi:DUF364 domain-containing protein [Beggiatoa leptomitoformis]|uniref:DUF364 domain-containing protein n=1 Tax=Beggiatoa leptomitoformis TaxID=288004 RepID=A0A2N9YB73_9GAMM|nr:DUF364 domain-containing protein [Beggiatoa leptomitoformis]ALG66940.1 hypothetical protein AL038_03425 [Beggiatoa leptomitoformis]AUI67694.1 hypothetical protein BLE401_02605 [Beggiatoa leptomitoformis]